MAELSTKRKTDEPVAQTATPTVHQMIRTIAFDGKDHADIGSFSVATIDANLEVWFKQGYQLQQTHYLGNVMGEGHAVVGYAVLYVLIK